MEDKNKMIKALEETLGVVTSAARRCNIARSTHYDWMTNDPEYKRQVEDIQDLTLDFVESQLHKQIQDGEVASTIFYMKTKGKRRGYVERTEIDMNTPVTLRIIRDINA